MSKRPRKAPAAADVHAIARASLRVYLDLSPLPRRTIAGRIGKTDTWLRRYLDGAFNARLEDLIALAGVFDLTLYDILNVPNAPTPGEQLLIRNYRALPAHLQRHVERQTEYLLPARPPSAQRRSRRKGA